MPELLNFSSEARVEGDYFFVDLFRFQPRTLESAESNLTIYLFLLSFPSFTLGVNADFTFTARFTTVSGKPKFRLFFSTGS